MFGRNFHQRNGKYNNTKVEIDGIKYDSKKESQRNAYLELMQKQGLISDLKRQVVFELIPTIYEDKVVHLKTKDKFVQRVAQKAVTYKADFTYIKDGQLVVEDVKASASYAALDKTFILKEKMMRYFHGIVIKRVYKANVDI